jgi:4'-phosphopantetheinyl transferase
VGARALLATGELLVRHAFTAQLASDAHRARCRAFLTEDERARELRFAFERDRDAFLVAHALVNTTLSELVGEAPHALSFELGEHGRPELVQPGRTPRVRFNLSHTEGLVACGFALEHDVGVDVEHVDRRVGIAEVAARVFSTDERRELDALTSDAARRSRFFQLWTLKEAYIKAIGKGLAAPLTEITFELADGVASPRVRFGPGVDDDASRYRIGVRPLGTGHVLAWAIAWPDARLTVEDHALPISE